MPKKQTSGPSNRALVEAVIFLLAVGIVCLEFWLLFKDWWHVLPYWILRNPITAPVIGIGLLAGPVALAMWMRTWGRSMGDETWEIRSGMRKR